MLSITNISEGGYVGHLWHSWPNINAVLPAFVSIFALVDKSDIFILNNVTFLSIFPSEECHGRIRMFLRYVACEK